MHASLVTHSSAPHLPSPPPRHHLADDREGEEWRPSQSGAGGGAASMAAGAKKLFKWIPGISDRERKQAVLVDSDSDADYDDDNEQVGSAHATPRHVAVTSWCPCGQGCTGVVAAAAAAGGGGGASKHGRGGLCSCRSHARTCVCIVRACVCVWVDWLGCCPCTAALVHGRLGRDSRLTSNRDLSTCVRALRTHTCLLACLPLQDHQLDHTMLASTDSDDEKLPRAPGLNDDDSDAGSRTGRRRPRTSTSSAAAGGDVEMGAVAGPSGARKLSAAGGAAAAGVRARKELQRIVSFARDSIQDIGEESDDDDRML